MKIVILGSGFGSNAEAILRARNEGRLGRAEPVGILSDNPDARILTLGQEFGIPAAYIPPGKYKTRLTPEAEAAYIKAIQEMGANTVVLAGFMRILKAPFLEAYPDKIINLHPSLLPAFKGLDAIGQAWRYGVRVTGCTVHWVNGDLDGGQIIDQVCVKIATGDTLETLREKIQMAEHSLLPSVIAKMSLGKLDELRTCCPD